MKFLLILTMMFVVPSAFGAYDCKIMDHTDGRWVYRGQFSFATTGNGQLLIKPIDMAGRYNLRAQDLPNSVVSLEIINRQNGEIAGGKVVMSGQPISLVFSDLEIYCLPK